MTKTRKSISIALMAIWLSATMFAFWWFQIRDLRAFDLEMSNVIEEIALVSKLRTLISQVDDQPARGFILNFWHPDCGCSRFNIDHVNTLKSDYEKQGFKLVTITRHSAEISDKELIRIAANKFNAPVVIADRDLFTGTTRIPAIPSAAVINEKGRLNYFGPYNDGTFCGIGGTRFVEKVADLVINNNTPNIINTMSFGCYCSWV